MLAWSFGIQVVFMTSEAWGSRGTFLDGHRPESPHGAGSGARAVLDQRTETLRGTDSAVTGRRHRGSHCAGDLQPNRIPSLDQRCDPCSKFRTTLLVCRIWFEALRVDALLPLA